MHEHSRATDPVWEAIHRATGGKPFVLAIMPYEPGLMDVFQVMRKTVESLGLSCIRANDIRATGYDLLGKVQVAIGHAELVIADVSEPNPNVAYELGYAAALNKPVLLTASRDSPIPFSLAAYTCVFYPKVGDPAQAQEFATQLRLALLPRLTPPEGIPSEISLKGVPSEIALKGYEEGPVKVEDYANFLRDLVFLHDHLWIAASEETHDYNLSAGYFYTRHGRPVPESQQLVLKRAGIGSPFELQILIPSATVIASIAVAYYQLVQAHRTRKLLPGDMRKQALDEEKVRRELDTASLDVDPEGQRPVPESDENQHSLRELLRELPRFAGEREDTIVRVVQRDLDRISGSPIRITEVIVVRTVKPKK